MKKKISILGVFAVDMTFIAEKFPKIGETILAHDFFLGPGGKGSNQAVASARLGSEVNFLTALGKDSYGKIGIDLYIKLDKSNYSLKDDNSYTNFTTL